MSLRSGVGRHNELHVDTGSALVRVTVRMTVSGEQQQTDHVDDEAGDADVDQRVDVLDLVRVRQSLDRLDEDGEAERDQEDGVDESPEHLGASPAERVLTRRLLRHLLRHTDDDIFTGRRRKQYRLSSASRLSSPTHRRRSIFRQRLKHFRSRHRCQCQCQ